MPSSKSYLMMIFWMHTSMAWLLPVQTVFKDDFTSDFSHTVLTIQRSNHPVPFFNVIMTHTKCNPGPCLQLFET